MKIGVISDTHGLIRPEAAALLRTCDVILHAGDIDTPEAYAQLQALGTLHAVRGNMDKEWAESLPDAVQLSLFGIQVFMTHKKKNVPEFADDLDLVVCGHTHEYKVKEKKKRRAIYLNPGSCGPCVDSSPTMAVVTVEDGRIVNIQRIDLYAAS